MVEKKQKRGGANRNQGLRPGTYKNAQKPPEKRHRVKKQVSYTPEEWKVIQAKIDSLDLNFSEFARKATLNHTGV